MKNNTALRVLFLIALLAAGFLPGPAARATPYASGLTNDGANISFRLNESADNVKIVSAAGTVTNDLGALAAGAHTFPLGISGVYQVEVFKASAAGFATAIAPNRGAVLQISTDANLLRFNNPRGLAVNNNPASPYFGRVYVANSSATNSPRAVGDGIYVLNPDMTDALGQGDTALTGGLDFTQNQNASPYRLTIGRDNNLYITDWSDQTGSLYVTDPNVAGGQNVLGGPNGGPFPVTTARFHGSIAGAVVEGSLAGGDLKAYVIDEDLQDDRATTTGTMRNTLWRHDIGATLPGPETMPTRLALHQGSFLRTVGNQTMEVARGTNGNFYISNYRSLGSEANVWVVDTNNAVIWNSLTETRNLLGTSTNHDVLRATGGLDISPAGDYLAIINIETNGMFILPILNGVPDITNRLLLAGFSTATGQGRDVAFDIAGNLYAVSSGAGMLRVFSPGGTATAITGSDGTFSMVSPPKVRVFATDDQGSEEGPNTISFDIRREVSTDQPLTVIYTLTGTATNGIDYVTDPLTAIIPAGETNVIVVITPIDDLHSDPAETVILTLVGTADYNTGSPTAATGTIVDNEPLLSVIAQDSEGNEEGPDPIIFEVFRAGVGSIAGPLTVTYTLTGTATNGVDYVTDPLTATIPAGETNVLVVITPSDDLLPEFSETVTITIVVNTNYTRTAPFSASGVIGDNEAPTLTIVSTGIDPYERFANNGNTFTITRRGVTNGDVFVVLEFTGTATISTDYIDPGALYMPIGAVTTNIAISPIDDASYEGNETVIATLISNGYDVGTPGSATVSIIDDECPPETVLFGDNFNTDSSANWIFIFGANTNVPDHTVVWAFDYSTMGIPAAPGSAGADTTGLRMTVNKNDSTNTSAAINLYPRNQSFSGDFALRFDLYIDVGNSNSTEHTLAGINHSGNNTNRVSQTPANHVSTAGADGIWFGIEAAAGNLRDYAAYTSTNSATVPALIATRAASTLGNVITRPPYSFVGSPGNASNSLTKTWAQVEISQKGSIVTLKVNKRTILSVTNTYGFNSGNVMIGYNDQFDSRGSPLNFAIFDNVRVVRLGISITDIDVSGNNVQIDFTSSEGEQAGDFRIESAESLSPSTWSTETASIVPNGNGFRATVQSTSPGKFFRVAK
jgi:Calx-beta domain-containing protein